MAFTLRQVSAYTLADSVASQKLFNANTTGAIEVVPGFYEFEAFIAVTGMSATSGNALVNIKGAGSATLARQLWQAVGFDAINFNVASTASASHQNQDASGAAVLSAGTGTGIFATLKGVFEVTVAGTIIPAITLLTGGVTPSVNAGSYFTVRLRSQGTSQTIYDDGGYRVEVSNVLAAGVRTITYSDGAVRTDKEG